MKTINNITMYDLMAEDHDVWLRKKATFGFVLEIQDEAGEIAEEQDLHPYAAEAMADFCRRYLSAYNHATAQGDL